ncbi:hypothetical protein ACGFZQ_24115 [Streptomyces sp. NPDC048254]|uniref:hypothetical protein n=1 Tax=Streptomyces sp. NPDC048254 TaxID=3365525 RepID=UPI003716EB7A
MADEMRPGENPARWQMDDTTGCILFGRRRVDEAVRPHDVSAGEDQEVRRAAGDHVGLKPRVQLRHACHAAARCVK